MAGREGSRQVGVAGRVWRVAGRRTWQKSDTARPCIFPARSTNDQALSSTAHSEPGWMPFTSTMGKLLSNIRPEPMAPAL